MTRFVWPCALLLTAAVLGCNKKPATPQAAIEKFLVAVNNEDADVFWTVSSKLDRSRLEELAKRRGQGSGKEAMKSHWAKAGKGQQVSTKLEMAEQREVHGCFQCIALFPGADGPPQMFTLILEDGEWRVCNSGCHMLPQYKPEKKMFLVRDGHKGDLENQFVLEYYGIKDKNQRKELVEKSVLKTISLTGTVVAVGAHGVHSTTHCRIRVGEGEAESSSSVGVWLDRYQYAGPVFYDFTKGHVSLQKFDGSIHKIDKGDKLTVVGILTGEDKGELEVQGALIAN